MAEYERSKNFSNYVVIICGIVNILNGMVFYMQTKTLGVAAFTRVWSIVDFIIIVTNLITVLNLIVDFQT
jgi:hypothetical protein